jgi:nitrogen fixation protein NifQ
VIVNADYRSLIEAGCATERLTILALAGVISVAPTRPAPYDVPIAGLARQSFADMMASVFPGFTADGLVAAMPLTQSTLNRRADEFEDLLDLLLEHCTWRTDECFWVAHALATASMGGNHLWQDMGLPDRVALSELIECNFTSLFVRNVGDMKWKKFLYRELCKRAEVMICKSPSCGVCVDYKVCFGKEEGLAPVSLEDVWSAANVA